MDYADLVKDFALRTRCNLEFVRQAAERQEQGMQAEVYEVTQLINSMLGLLVFPQQRYIDVIPETPIHELIANGWPKIRISPGFPDKVETLKQLVRYLRNAIAHFNMDFVVNERDHISGVRVWNQRNRERTWMAEFSLEDLEKFTGRFVEMLLK